MLASSVQSSLEQDLLDDTGMPMVEYLILMMLSEADGGALRMCDVAAHVPLTPSGLTRRMDTMVRAGLVRRVTSGDDRRVVLAELTELGRARIEAAAPRHVEHVRRHFVDHLTDPEDLADLARILNRIVAARDAAALADPQPH